MKLQQYDGYQYIDGGVCAAHGFMANGVQCGLAHKAIGNEDAPKKNIKKNDLALIYSDCRCAAAAVYTTNKVKGAPIAVTRQHISDGYAQAVIVNSVNANTCNADGELKANMMCSFAANALSIDENDVIVASTGVIGQPLPIEPIEAGVPGLAAGLKADGNEEALEAIMTTDTQPKEVAVSFMLGDKKCSIGGMLKGSGMIHPNMATTLSFITTDVSITPMMLQKALSENVVTTLNRVSVDGDTSTNDMSCVLANAKAGNDIISSENEDFAVFSKALFIIMRNLAKMMARDGEGATKLIECCCSGAEDEKTAETVAKSVITSSLFKAAMFGEDANWGRILCAVGYAQADFDISCVDVDICSENGKVEVCRNGAGVDFSEEEAKKVLQAEEIRVEISIGDGNGTATAWGCDLTYNYVKINGDYRS